MNELKSVYMSLFVIYEFINTLYDKITVEVYLIYVSLFIIDILYTISYFYNIKKFFYVYKTIFPYDNSLSLNI